MSATYPESKREPLHVFNSVADLNSCAGRELEPSEWHEVGQSRIDLFAEATADHQWIHVDPIRASAGPFGTTIAHGYLTLSLLPMLMAEVVDFENISMTVNYGFEKVRFPAPVRSGDLVRGRVSLAHIEERSDATQVTFGVVIEAQGETKPVCIAQPVWRVYFH